MIAGGVDAMFDYTVSNGFSSSFKDKNSKLTFSDFIFNSLGNAGGLSFGKNPILFESIGTAISVFPTTIFNKVVNDKIGN